MNAIISKDRRGSLQRQILIYVNVTLIVILGIILFYDYSTQRRIIEENHKAFMKQGVQHIILALSGTDSFQSAIQTLQEYCKVMSYHEDPSHDITLMTLDGKIITSSKNTLDIAQTMKELKTLQENNGEWHWSETQLNGRDTVSLMVPFEKQWNDRAFKGILRYAESAEPIHRLFNRIFLNHAMAMLSAMILVSILLWWLIKRQILGPLDRLFIQAYAIGQGDYITWEASEIKNELYDIQIMFNHMSEKIRSHEEAIVKKERKSAVIETSAQVYSKLIPTLNQIIEICGAILHENGSQPTSKLIFASEIRHHCQDVLEELSCLTDVLDQPVSEERPIQSEEEEILLPKGDQGQ